MELELLINNLLCIEPHSFPFS